jgi:hypothetical protein
MEKIYLVYDEYRYDSREQGTIITACATMEVAIKVVKERYEWYLKNSYLARFVGITGDDIYLKEDMLEKFDIWEVDEDSVEIYIYGKDTRLDLHIAEHSVVCE